MEALKVVWSQLVKNVDRAPGWVPLLVCAYLMLALYGVPATVSVAGITLPLSVEVLAGLATLVFYYIGDAADEWVFKTGSGESRGTRPHFKHRYESEQRSAQARLGVTSGSYELAAKLTNAAEKDRRTILVHGFNEAAKFLRGLALPLFILCLLALVQRQLPLAAGLALSGATALAAYPELKVRHIKRLYSLASQLAGDRRFSYRDLGQVRLYFWDGNFVASACRPDPGAPAAA